METEYCGDLEYCKICKYLNETSKKFCSHCKKEKEILVILTHHHLLVQSQFFNQMCFVSLIYHRCPLLISDHYYILSLGLTELLKVFAILKFQVTSSKYDYDQRYQAKLIKNRVAYSNIALHSKCRFLQSFCQFCKLRKSLFDKGKNASTLAFSRSLCSYSADTYPLYS